MTDLEKVKKMEDANWKPAATYWLDQYNRQVGHSAKLEVVIDELLDKIKTLEETVNALSK